MADLFLPDGGYLHLEADWGSGMGWWRVDEGCRPQRLTVAEAFLEAPASLRHEVLLEARDLVSTELERYLREGSGDARRHEAITCLSGEIRSAMATLADSPSMRTFGRDLSDHMV